MALGRFNGVRWGPGHIPEMVVSTTASTVAMTNVNAGCCYRWQQRDARKVNGIAINWSSVTSPGTMRATIETVDTSTGRPTGTLWDANATIDFTPTSGWQTLTFASAPTTPMTPGAVYALVLDSRTGGGVTLLNAYYPASTGQGVFDAQCLTTSTVGTRSSFSEVGGGCIPIGTLTYDDGSEEAGQWSGYQGFSTINLFGTTDSGGLKLTVPANCTYSAWGAYLFFPLKNGTPAGDLVLKLWDNAGNPVSNGTITLNKNMLMTNLTQRRISAGFPGSVSLAAGDYHLIAESQNSVNSANCWVLRSATARVAALNPSGMIKATSGNINGSPPTFTTTATGAPTIGLWLDDITGSGGGSGGVSLARVAA